MEKRKKTHDGPNAPAVGADKLPDDTWQLPTLAAFITATCRRSGVDAWWIGKALLIARAKHKEERDWLRWLAEEVKVLGKSTAYRYMDICESFELKDVEGKTINALYKLLGIKDDGPTAPIKAADKGNKDARGGTGNGDKPRDNGEQQQPTHDKQTGGDAPVTGEKDSDNNTKDDPEPTEPPQPPITAAEIDALERFIVAVGGLTRAEYVFERGVEHLRELNDED